MIVAVPALGAAVIVAVRVSPPGEVSLASTLTVPVWSSAIVSVSSVVIGVALTVIAVGAERAW